MGPRLNWIRKARWMNSGFPGTEEWSREKNLVDKVSVLQQQILTLTEEVKSQKVSVVKRLLFLRVRALMLVTGTPLHIGVVGALSTEKRSAGSNWRSFEAPGVTTLYVPKCAQHKRRPSAISTKYSWV